MKQKFFIAVMLCCTLVPVLVLGAYTLGVKDGYDAGFKKGDVLGTAHSPQTFDNGYLKGYNDGVKAAQATPPPIP
jgi:hypothetical protein